MTRLQFLSIQVALALLFGAIRADEPKKPQADPANKLIDQVTEVSRQDTGYSGSVSGRAFLPLGQHQPGAMLLGQRPRAESEAMRSLVKLGVKAVPSLLEHLIDDRKAKIAIEHAGVFGALFIGQDEGEHAEPAGGGST